MEGPLAFQMRRFTAAEINDCGLHILNLPQVAARLAGGFTIAASVEQLEPAIQEALDEGGFVELERVRHLPGMTRAVLRTLRKIWAADFDLAAAGRDRHRRILEMSLIEARLKSRLPQAVMMPRNLRDAALKRIRHAPRILGEIRIEGISFIAPVWRPLIEALREVVPVEWIAPTEADTGWFRGKIARLDPAAMTPAVVSCADIRHEVVESLDESRWPVYGKLHGDYHSDALKNTDAELRQQDAEMRRSLVDSCRRQGIVRVNSILPVRAPGRAGAPLFLLANCRRARPDFMPKIAYAYLP